MRIKRIILEHHGDIAVFGRDIIDKRSLIQISPEVTSSNPAIMRKVVDLPQPEGPDKYEKLLVADFQINILDGIGTALIPFAKIFDPDIGHN